MVRVEEVLNEFLGLTSTQSSINVLDGRQRAPGDALGFCSTLRRVMCRWVGLGAHEVRHSLTFINLRIHKKCILINSN